MTDPGPTVSPGAGPAPAPGRSQTVGADHLSGAGPTVERASCCTDFYQIEWVRDLAQGSFHPGGVQLTKKTLQQMALHRGARLMDIGCGAGGSCQVAAHDLGLKVCGVDLGQSNLVYARDRIKNFDWPSVESADVHDSPQPEFLAADAQSLPFRDNTFDALLAECSFSLLTDQPAALVEFGRVLRPGGHLGLTDMAISGSLSGDLAELTMPWACLDGANSESDYRKKFRQAGLHLTDFGDESAGLVQMMSRIRRRLLLAAAGSAIGQSPLPPLPIEQIRNWMDLFQNEVQAGKVRYLRFNLQTSA